jgi:phosphoribosyl-ATP pyrophosphohydrolase/phosphoribosyl-AMP cyclohydrolase
LKTIIAYIDLNENNINDIINKCIEDGADELMFFDSPKDESKRRHSLELLQKIAAMVSIPFGVYLGDKTLEEIKYTLYTGVNFCYIENDRQDASFIIDKARKRFGENKIRIYMKDFGSENLDFIFIKAVDSGNIKSLKQNIVQNGDEIMEKKSTINFKDCKTDSNGLIPVVVQDYKTKNILMLAYMNEEAFNKTVESGKMTYYSRSRQALWIKGETSGHFQFVKNLYIDCDNDTLLAKVKQIGVACHTGNESCFFTNVVENDKEYKNSLTVLENLYNVIEDRRVNPKEGSYTNYLFNKGLDKILKKIGEEATETVIAAKNEDGYEIKYEIADLLYHLTVLMVKQKVTWEDIMSELAARE